MNGFEKLSDDEIWMVIEFIYSKWPEDIKNIYNEKKYPKKKKSKKRRLRSSV